MYKGSYKDDLKDGIWEHYDRDGKVISIKIYQNGIQI
jgi:antitoxin component YwqK of YwqJK toxin-antitoxin module